MILRRLFALALLLTLSGCSRKPAAQIDVRPYAERVGAAELYLIRFMATWCFPCVTDLPTLTKLQSQHAARGLKIIAIGMDLEGESVLGPFRAYQKLDFPLIEASASIRNGLSSFGRIGALPTTFLLDAQGKVIAGFEGVASYESLSRLIEDTLQK